MKEKQLYLGLVLSTALILPSCLCTSSFVYESSLTNVSCLEAIPSDIYFLYYDPLKANRSSIPELSSWARLNNRTLSVVLNEGFQLINRSRHTFLDVRYNETLYQDILTTFSSTIKDLLPYGVSSYVLGDDYPYGLTKGGITVEKILPYNEAYHSETGSWIRMDPDGEDRCLIARWFYSRSVEALNRLASDLHASYPNISLGLNLEAYRPENMDSDDVSRWCQLDLEEIDLEPYEFVVACQYTKIPKDRLWEVKYGPPSLSIIDAGGLLRLSRAFERIAPLAGRVKIFFMLAAHSEEATSPSFVITPMQMVLESILTMEQGFDGVGWFAIDTVGDTCISIADPHSNAWERPERLATLQALCVDVSNRWDSLTSALGRTTASLQESLDASEEELLRNISRLEANYEQIDTQIQTAFSSLGHTSSQLSGLKHRIDDIQRDLSGLAEDLNSTEAGLEMWNSTLGRVIPSLERELRLLAEETRRRIDNMSETYLPVSQFDAMFQQSSSRAIRPQIRSLELSVSRLNLSVRQVEADLPERIDKVNRTLTTSTEAIRTQVSGYEGRIEELEGELDRLRDTLLVMWPVSTGCAAAAALCLGIWIAGRQRAR